VKQPELKHYPYWSKRLVEEAADDYRVSLRRRPLSFSFGFKGAQAAFGEGRTELFRAEVEDRLIRVLPVEPDRSFATSVSPVYAAGTGRVEMGRFRAWPNETFTAYAHVRVDEGNGQTVDVCLFGSMHNYTSWVRGVDQSPAGWISSSAPDIVALLESAGQTNLLADDAEDYEPIAVEALKVVTGQGIWAHSEAHNGLPESRAYTLGYANPARWCVRIYLDVMLTEDRWLHMDELGNPRRILVGAPLWIRTSSAGLIPYTRARRAPAIELVMTRQRELEAASSSRGIELVSANGGQETARLTPDPGPVRRNLSKRIKRRR